MMTHKEGCQDTGPKNPSCVVKRQATASSHCTIVPPYDEDLVSPHPCCVLPSIIAANDFGGELKALYDSMNPTGIFPTLLTAWTLLS